LVKDAVVNLEIDPVLRILEENPAMADLNVPALPADPYILICLRLGRRLQPIQKSNDTQQQREKRESGEEPPEHRRKLYLRRNTDGIGFQ
jgi:hypothetical protein